ncbi:hypothetical protein [Actinoplanes sp. NPDC049265]|uniref:hypothetical protein n=1 Tax=Actinoplanes sp. NPDC049265 TaxID=3363902 RepID=UPI003715DB63
MTVVTFTRPVPTVFELYAAASDTGDDAGWLGYVLPGAPADLTSFTLTDAVAVHPGSFTFASTAPTLTGDGAGTFVAEVKALLTDTLRRWFWLARPDRVDASTSNAFAFDASAGQVRMGTGLSIGANLELTIINGAGFGVQETGLVLSSATGGAAPVAWTGPAALSGGYLDQAVVVCAGAARGSVRLTQAMDRSALHDQLTWGFQTVAADSAAPSGQTLGWYPLADGATGPQVAIQVTLDPLDVFNATGVERTSFAFADATTSLVSGYRTSAGWTVTLCPVVTPPADGQPARLWLHPAPVDSTAQRDFVACPVGDFTVDVQRPAGATSEPELLCGLSGSETIGFTAGDTMRFTPQQPAFAARYPYAVSSPVAAPVDPLAPRLDSTFTTSWGALVTVAGDGGHYCAQPKGAALYAKPAGADAGVLTRTQPGSTLADSVPLPLMPYGLVTAATGYTYSMPEFVAVETNVVAAERRRQVTASSTGLAPARSRSRSRDGGGPATIPATTPAGFVVQVGGDGAYAEIDLAQDTDRAPPVVMKLMSPSAAMHEAFQTSDLFLVVANADALGTLAGWPSTEPAGTAFYNAMTIGDWALLADVGRHQSYGDYGNVLIVKGRTGKLADLIARPDAWTQPSLAIPGGASGQAAELSALSGWLQDYLSDAAEQTSDYFAAFNHLVRDDTWTGVLVLKADIAAVPAQLTGMLGGVDRTRFNAHHFGFTITRVDPGTVAMTGNSATFGLIYYVDPAFDATAATPRPVAPATSPWEFRVLTLKVLFANAAVERFESYAQLALGELFEQAVDHMGAPGANPYDALILSGSLHQQNGVSSYSLEAEGDATFFFAGGVFNKIEVSQVEFATTGRIPREDGSTEVSARFDLYGFLDFVTVTADCEPFDLLSFGSTDGNAPRQGLAFAGLGITMGFDEPADPSKPTGTPAYAFDATKIAFDPARSTLRPGSLADNLALKVDSLILGGADAAPTDLGYLGVGTEARLAGVQGDWYGLRLQVNLGTPGALAGAAGLTTPVLLAWSAPAKGSTTLPLGVWLLLPGTSQGSSLLSLQGVLRLAVGPILLKRVPAERGGRAFMLVMTEIALRFLGLLKLPPNGATSFYLFGDPSGGGGPLGWFAIYQESGVSS